MILLAGMLVALTLAAAFIVWDGRQLMAQIDRDALRWHRRPSPVEREANLLWRTHRHSEFQSAMTLTLIRDWDRLATLIAEPPARRVLIFPKPRDGRGLLNPGKPCVGKGLTEVPPASHEQLTTLSRAFPGLSSRSPA